MSAAALHNRLKASHSPRPEMSFPPDTRKRIENTTVLIPAAGRVPEGIIALSNISCPAMIPVGGRPVIHWTMSYLRSLGLRRFIIAVAHRGMYVEDFVECTFGKDCDITFTVPTTDASVGGTLHDLAEATLTESALVVLGDTHFQFIDVVKVLTDESAVLVHPVEDSYRWCIAETDASGYISELHDKVPDLAGHHDALIGVYYFPSVNQLRQASHDAIDAARQQHRRAELADILSEVSKLGKVRAYPTEDWLDCGNPDRLASSHRTLLQKRAFNELSIDSVFGTITKRSRNVEKFLDEINYLRLLPAHLSVLFPRVVDFSTNWNDPFVTMEYYGYPTLAEAFFFENVNLSLWEQILNHLHKIVVQGFKEVHRPVSRAVIEEMYLKKTRERLSAIDAPSALRTLVESKESIVINGREVASLLQLWPRIETAVEELATTSIGSVIHGDLCLSNILYDLRSRICKFVDPRGSFGGTGIYGDLRYDVAKLYHSIYGLYDFIVNDLFHVSVDGRNVQLEIRSRSHHAEICHRFEQVFFCDFVQKEILLITALLFASMPVLHYDSPDRQIAMFTRSLQLFDEYFNPKSSETFAN